MAEYPHYYKQVKHLDAIDVYRVLELYQVTDAAIGHAVKKLLCAGDRGAKDYRRDLEEARDAITRRLQMLDEDAARVTDERIDRMFGAT